MAEETETDIIVEETFSISTPVPSNSRLISIAGVIPSCDSPAYWLFEKFLWTLIELDKIPNAPITLFINSCGGDADSLFSFYDFVAMLKSPIHTVASKAESAGAMMFILGARGHRYIFPSAHLMLHCAQSACSNCEEEKKKKRETEKENKLLNLYNRRLANIIDKCTKGKILDLLGDWSSEKNEDERIQAILSLLSKDLILTAKEAIEYGLADHIITPQIFAELSK